MTQKQTLTKEQVEILRTEMHNKIHDILYKGTGHICDAQRWLIISRVINFIFNNHYRPVMAQSLNLVENEERKLHDKQT